MAENEAQTRSLLAQFGEMLRWRARGWRPAAPGHRCRHCGGNLWSKMFGLYERFMCTRCGRAFEKKVM